MPETAMLRPTPYLFLLILTASSGAQSLKDTDLKLRYPLNETIFQPIQLPVSPLPQASPATIAAAHEIARVTAEKAARAAETVRIITFLPANPLDLLSKPPGTVLNPTAFRDAAGNWNKTQQPLNKAQQELVPRLWRTMAGSDSGFTALHFAAMRQDHASMRALLAAGHPKSPITKKWHASPLRLAADLQDLEGARILMGIGPDSPARNKRVTIKLDSQTVVVETRSDPQSNWSESYRTKTSTGKRKTPTPTGVFFISDKHISHTSTLFHVKMPWFMRFSLSSVGMHQGYVPDYAASHGCVRLPETAARDLFRQLPVGTEVRIQ